MHTDTDSAWTHTLFTSLQAASPQFQATQFSPLIEAVWTSEADCEALTVLALDDPMVSITRSVVELFPSHPLVQARFPPVIVYFG